MIYTTLKESIEAEKDSPLTHRALNNYIMIKDIKSGEIIKCPFNHIISKYRDLFNDNVLEIQLTETEKNIYDCNPRLMSFKTYGTVEYWSIILYLNEVGSPLDFHPDKVKLIIPENMKEIINEILQIQSAD
jgi:hypothetical protein